MGNDVARRVLLLASDAIDAGDGPELARLRVRGRSARLPFYAKLRLVWLRATFGRSTVDVFCLWDREGKLLVIDGSSAPVHEANDFEKLALDDGTVADYVRFFCFAVRGDEGAFTLLEPGIDVAGQSRPFPVSGGRTSPRLVPLMKPLEVAGRDDEKRHLVNAVVAYDSGVYSAVFAVAGDGQITMVSDEPVASLPASTRFPAIPDHNGAAQVMRFLAEHRAAPAPPPAQAAPAALPPGAPAVAPPAAHPRRPTLRVLVSLLLESALAARSTNRLIEQFNSRMAGRSALEQFAELVIGSSPVTVIESDIPFVEEIVVSVIEDIVGKQRMVPFTTDGSVSAGPGIVVLRAANLDGSERLSHSIAMSEAAVLIGCERFADLPENLRRLGDVTLRLPRLDPGLFARLFAEVFGAPLPEAWREAGTDWVRHVLHSDFEQPVRLRLAADKAMEYIRGQVLDRVRAVDTGSGPRLDELHGLGEARQVAKDLIADIAAAVRGELPWSQVDRGMLLAGAPGTGKTTLARAIARDCGIRFVQASASTWHGARDLALTIQAVRASFAEARRYAPAILFIDEIDSLGNRERLGGEHNDQYWTQIINAVLEQMQGVDEEAPVFVIAATNYEERVDPALKRAGRLDHVIRIPHPTSDALAKIYDQYLEPHKTSGNIDTRVIGRMSFGLTGADVESLVRGAARRARKARRALSQADLLAELTRQPRDPGSSPRLSRQEIDRIAVHEAGHALARCLGPSRGRDIAFVSIVPRSDGTLGFVASAPRQRTLWSRQEYLRHIEVLLAGRAAEEITFGADGITGGARNDLAVASNIAMTMVSEDGLGPDGSLLALPRPSGEQMTQADAILRAAYRSVLAKLTARLPRLQALADALRERQELSGPELLRAVARRRQRPAAGRQRRRP